jgi:hypothetical protein
LLKIIRVVEEVRTLIIITQVKKMKTMADLTKKTDVPREMGDNPPGSEPVIKTIASQ